MRIALLALLACICLLPAPGCSSKKASPREAGGHSTATKKAGDGTGAVEKWTGGDAKSESSPPVALPSAPPAVADAVSGSAKGAWKKPQAQQLASGILTAGSFDDNLDPLVFHSLLRKLGNEQTPSTLPSQFLGQRVMILVKDEAGKAVADARVQIIAGAVEGPELITRADGRAIFLLSWDKLPADQPLVATVRPGDNSKSVTVTIQPGVPRWEVTLPETQARLPKNLDLLLVVDTTGSMGDELAYLKAEFRGISAAIKQKFPEVEQRFGLILYRDQGDEYVTRRFDFTPSLQQFHDNLAAQSAGGGGDYPEAVHKALEDVQQLRWRERDTARILFLVGDAPPHAQHIPAAFKAIDHLRRKGIACYPVACSGYDPTCEFVMRAGAMLTGSQFLFLTDDSGVGGSHAEPTIPYYQVERLERLMVRMIAGELTGRTLPANPADVIRTVGKKVN